MKPYYEMDYFVFVFALSSIIIVSTLLIDWLHRRREMFKAFDKYAEFTGKRHPKDWRKGE